MRTPNVEKRLKRSQTSRVLLLGLALLMVHATQDRLMAGERILLKDVPYVYQRQRLD